MAGSYKYPRLFLVAPAHDLHMTTQYEDNNLSRLDRLDFGIDQSHETGETTPFEWFVAGAGVVGLGAYLFFGIKPTLAVAVAVADALGFL
jgi:hypothetical protein